MLGIPLFNRSASELDRRADADHIIASPEEHAQAHQSVQAHDNTTLSMDDTGLPAQSSMPQEPLPMSESLDPDAPARSQHASPEGVEPAPERSAASEAHRRYGEYLQYCMEAPLERLQPNSQHCRTDWSAHDDEFDALLAQIKTAGGLTTPLVCIWGGPSGHDLLIVKGHRRFAAAQAAGLATVPVRILRQENGQPLESYQQLELWLRESTAIKSPTERHTTIAIIWWYQALPPNDPKRELAQAKVAKLLHVSTSTVNWAKRLAEQPTAVGEAVADQTLPVTTAVKLVEMAPDPAKLLALIQQVRDENARRQQRSERPLTEREILHLTKEQPRERTFQAPVGRQGGNAGRGSSRGPSRRGR